MKKITTPLILLFISLSLSSQSSLNMQRVGLWHQTSNPTYSGIIYNDIWGYTDPSGGEYAIIGNVDSIFVINVTDCTSPQKVFAFNGGDRVVWRDFKTFGTYAYGVCDSCNEGLHVFDLSGLPGSVNHVLSTTAFFQDAHNIYIDEANQRLYCVGVNGSTDVTVLDLSVDPANPSLLKNIDFNAETGDVSTSFYVHDIYVKNNIAYTSHGYTGFYVWDLNDLNNITLMGSKVTGGYNHSSWTSDDDAYAYYAEEVPSGRPMGVMDLSNLSDPLNDINIIHTFTHAIESSGSPTPHNPFVHNNKLYISYYEDGVKVYDLSNPTTPTLEAYYDTYPTNMGGYSGTTGNWGIYPFLSSGCILASDVTYGLNLLKIDTPPNPLLPPCDVIMATYNNAIPDNTDLHALDWIKTDGNVNPSETVKFTAVNYIELQPQFETILGSDFEAVIGPCDPANLLTDEQKTQEVKGKR